MNNKETTKSFIKDFISQQLKEGKSYVFGGIIEDYMRTKIGTKGESTSRICRFMVEDGTLEPVYIPREKGRSNVAYKLNEETKTIDTEKESVVNILPIHTEQRLEERTMQMCNVWKDNGNQGSTGGTRDRGATQLSFI